MQGAVDLAPQAARSGRLGLRLSVSPLDPKNPPAAIESPPVLFTSPAVQVAAGQIVCIHGWVQVPVPITAGPDGLLVVDSISGEALADRIGQTKGWREFAMYRVATQSGPVCVTFALSGIGEAWLDDVANRSRGRPLIADRQWFYPPRPVPGNAPTIHPRSASSGRGSTGPSRPATSC